MFQIDRRTGEGFESRWKICRSCKVTRISTKDDGRVEIEFRDGSTVRLALTPASSSRRLSLHDSGARTQSWKSAKALLTSISTPERRRFVVDLGDRSDQSGTSSPVPSHRGPVTGACRRKHGQVDLSAPGLGYGINFQGKNRQFRPARSDNYTWRNDMTNFPYDPGTKISTSYHSRNFHHANSRRPTPMVLAT